MLQNQALHTKIIIFVSECEGGTFGLLALDTGECLHLIQISSLQLSVPLELLIFLQVRLQHLNSTFRSLSLCLTLQSLP